MTTQGGVQETLTLEKNGVAHVHVEFIPEGEPKDIATLRLHGPFAQVDPLLLEFVPQCVPDNPFYVRWINRQGGYDYKMFEARHWFTRSTSDNRTYTPFQYSTPDARSQQERLGYEAKEIQQVGATRLTHQEFMTLSAIQFSPKIEVYDRATAVWKLITVEGNSAGEWDSGGRLATFEIKFRLPNPNTQQ